MKHLKRLAPLVLAAVLVLGAVPARAAEAEALTRGEAAELLLAAGADYNPGLQRSDILKGYPNGELDLDGPVTRAQALVMLDRAFGGLPEAAGTMPAWPFPRSSSPICRRGRRRRFPTCWTPASWPAPAADGFPLTSP